MNNNIEAEQQVIGILLNKPLILDDMRLSKKHFTIKEHTYTYEAVQALYEANIEVDIISVVTWLEKENKSVAVEYLTDIMQSVFTDSNFEYYYEMLEKERQKRVLEHLQKSLDKTLKSEKDLNISEVMESINGTLDRIKITNTNTVLDMKQLDEISYQSYLNREKDGIDVSAISSGYPSIDYYTGGIKKSDLIIVAARPSVGKTALALNIAKSTASINKTNVIIFSLEMSASKLYERMLMSASGINSRSYKNAALTKDEKQKDINARTRLKELGIMVEDSSMIKVSDIKSICKKIKREKGELGLVVIDYLQLIEPKSNKENRQVQVSQISRELKQLAKELDVCVIALSQLSRAVENREGSRPKLSDLRDSGAIEADADIVSLLYREDYQSDEAEAISDVELIIAKNRDGRTGTAHLKFDKPTSNFYER